MITTTLLEDASALEALTPRWRELLERAASPEPTQTPLWLLTWWKEFGHEGGRKMRVVAFEEDGRLIGLAPLLERRAFHKRVVPFERIELLASGEDEADEICSDYIGVICEAGRENAVAGELARALEKGAVGRWDELLMPAMNGELGFVAALERALASASARVSLEPFGSCPYIALPSTWDAYLKALDKQQRYGINRTLRDLEAWAGPGGYELHRASSREELGAAREILVNLHEEQWQERGKPGAFANARFARFHDAIMQGFIDGVDGGLDLLWLTVKGEPIAALYNLVYRKKSYVYQSGRKIDVPKGIRPGIAVHALAIKRAIENGMREYDFLNGASTYKKQLCTSAHPLVRLRAVAPSMRARALETARLAAEQVAMRLRPLRAVTPPAETA